MPFRTIKGHGNKGSIIITTKHWGASSWLFTVFVITNPKDYDAGSSSNFYVSTASNFYVSTAGSEIFTLAPSYDLLTNLSMGKACK